MAYGANKQVNRKRSNGREAITTITSPYPRTIEPEMTKSSITSEQFLSGREPTFEPLQRGYYAAALGSGDILRPLMFSKMIFFSGRASRAVARWWPGR